MVTAVADSPGVLSTLSDWWNSWTGEGVSSKIESFSTRRNQDIEKVLNFNSKSFLGKQENDVTRSLAKVSSSFRGVAQDARTELFSLLAKAEDNSDALVRIIQSDTTAIGATLGKQQLKPIHYAAYVGSAWAIGVLLEHGASLECFDRDGNTPLHLASSSLRNGVSGRKALSVLLKHSSAQKFINSSNNKGLNAVCMACMTGDEGSLQLLLSNGGDAFHREARMGLFKPISGDCFTPLCYAAQSGSSKCVRLLLEKNVDVKHKAKGGITPLHIAASSGSEASVRLLLKAGANANTLSDTGAVPLSVACAHGSLGCAKALLDSTDSKHVLPSVYEALSKGKVGCAYLLVYRNLHSSLDFSAALFLAIESNVADKDILEILIQTDAMNARLKSGDTPLKLASRKGNEVAISLLLNAKNWTETDLKDAESVAANKDIRELIMPSVNLIQNEVCVCCLAAPANVVFLPCNHVQCCASCTGSVMRVDPRCPMCREDITETKRM
mmetsp:Transcript_18211/g.22133  ORF Transcript_18211/g.22133 Transcript_18211/m.22133 type:complete len:498 (+) Transcript_18211:162-1655(+)